MDKKPSGIKVRAVPKKITVREAIEKQLRMLEAIVLMCPPMNNKEQSIRNLEWMLNTQFKEIRQIGIEVMRKKGYFKKEEEKSVIRGSIYEERTN